VSIWFISKNKFGRTSILSPILFGNRLFLSHRWILKLLWVKAVIETQFFALFREKLNYFLYDPLKHLSWLISLINIETTLYIAQIKIGSVCLVF
jgi:hypothetical protein